MCIKGYTISVMNCKIPWYGNGMVEIYGVYKGLHDLILGLVS